MGNNKAAHETLFSVFPFGWIVILQIKIWAVHLGW